MLLIASQRLGGARAVSDVSRELNLTLVPFASPETLAERLASEQRRIVLLAESDLDHSVIDRLCAAAAKTPLAVLIAAERPRLHASDRAFMIDRLREIPVVDWIGRDFDFDRLADSARFCRRRMVRISSSELGRAFDEGQLVIQYQPKVERDSSAEWTTREAEALVRWQHPEHGMLGPLEFLPEIEEFGMAARLAGYVLEKAALQLQVWQQQGMTLNACINLSSSLLSDPALSSRFAETVAAHGLECGRFTFELVERDLADPSAPHLQALEGYRQRGFRLSLDDFRVAAASLLTLERLPFDEIKIHGSAIAHAQQDTVAQHVLVAVAGLAHNLGMSVCAEGVEDQATFEFLKTIDCDKMQGFLVSEAVLPDIIKESYAAPDSGAEVA